MLKCLLRWWSSGTFLCVVCMCVFFLIYSITTLSFVNFWYLLNDIRGIMYSHKQNSEWENKDWCSHGMVGSLQSKAFILLFIYIDSSWITESQPKLSEPNLNKNSYHTRHERWEENCNETDSRFYIGWPYFTCTDFVLCFMIPAKGAIANISPISCACVQDHI